MPDAAILLDISPKTTLKRKKDTQGDPFDEEELDYHKRVVKGYRKMAISDWGGFNWYIVNGERKIKKVSRDVTRVLEKILKTDLD